MELKCIKDIGTEDSENVWWALIHLAPTLKKMDYDAAQMSVYYLIVSLGQPPYKSLTMSAEVLEEMGMKDIQHEDIAQITHNDQDDSLLVKLTERVEALELQITKMHRKIDLVGETEEETMDRYATTYMLMRVATCPQVENK